MTQKENKKVKFATIRVGKICLIFIYILAAVTAFGCFILLLFGNDIGFAFLGLLLFVFVPIIVLMHFHNAGNTVTFVEDKIQSKRRTLTWDTVCLTVHCHHMLGSHFPAIWLYFDDHYLTEKEIRSWRVSRQGLVLRLDNIEKAQFILSHCKNKIEMCGECRCWDRYNIEKLSMIDTHNARFK